MLGRTCEPFIPSFAQKYIDAALLQAEAWPDDNRNSFLQTLAAGRSRIFQEILMTDPLPDAIIKFLRSHDIG